MKATPGPLKDAFVIEFQAFEDNRGLFTRTYCQKELLQIGFEKNILQANISRTSSKGAIRGMHYQIPPKAEVKLIRCIGGAVFDVIVDLRKNSPSFLKWHGEILSPENKKMMYIPEGFAHGFQTIQKDSELLYFHSEFYSPEHESAIRFDDPSLSIKWPLKVTDISARDKSHPLLSNDFKGVEI